MGTFEFWRLSILEIGPLLMVIGSGGLVSAISGLPFGRWAGKAGIIFHGNENTLSQ